MERTYKDGQEVLDMTGTDFNLLISVIGATGSPYLVEYLNNLVTMIRNNPNTLSRIRYVAGTTIGMKRLINQRYKLDPLKNKQRCVSSIDQDFVGHIKSAHKEDGEEQISEKLILAYFPQNQEDVYWMGNDDLMTEYDRDRSDPTRKRVPHKDNQDRICYLKLQDLNATTIGDDNEIIIDSYPGAVMCFDRVSNIARKTAEKLQVPILYIDSQRQFQIMEKRLNQYYSDVKARMIQEKQMTEELFNDTFNSYDLNRNIIHRAFKIANSFGYLDEDEYPQEEIINIFEQMKQLVSKAQERSNDKQKQEIQSIMNKYANPSNLRYSRYNRFIDFEELNEMVDTQRPKPSTTR